MTNEEFQILVLEELKGLKNDIGELKEEQGKISNMVNSIHEQTIELTEFRQETSDNFDKIEGYIHDVDVQNADRHFEFIKELKELKHSVNRIEINTAENWRDIARLKSRKNNIRNSK